MGKQADALSKRARDVLGPNGISRFQEFAGYREGWDFGKGKTLSSSSVTRLDDFLHCFSTFNNSPSLFLTRGGNLQLGWENDRGGIELEFLPRGFLLYLEESDTELEFSPDQLNDLIQFLSARYPAHGAA